MLYEFMVAVSIRAGLGPGCFVKHFSVAFDDVPEDESIEEVKLWAKAEVEERLRNTIDFPLYGKYWEIIEVYET